MLEMNSLKALCDIPAIGYSVTSFIFQGFLGINYILGVYADYTVFKV